MPRFQARWTNGYWKLFDAQIFTDLAIFGLRVEAIEAATAANRRS